MFHFYNVLDGHHNLRRPVKFELLRWLLAVDKLLTIRLSLYSSAVTVHVKRWNTFLCEISGFHRNVITYKSTHKETTDAYSSTSATVTQINPSFHKYCINCLHIWYYQTPRNFTVIQDFHVKKLVRRFCLDSKNCNHLAPGKSATSRNLRVWWTNINHEWMNDPG